MSGTFSRRASVECRGVQERNFSKSNKACSTIPNFHLTANHSDQEQKRSDITRRSRHTVRTDCSRIYHNLTLTYLRRWRIWLRAGPSLPEQNQGEQLSQQATCRSRWKRNGCNAFLRSPGRRTLSQKPNHIKNTFFSSLTFPSTPDTSPSGVPGEDANALCTHSGRASAFLCPLHRRPRLLNELHMLAASLFISHST